jgi:hypothetical protein
VHHLLLKTHLLSGIDMFLYNGSGTGLKTPKPLLAAPCHQGSSCTAPKANCKGTYNTKSNMDLRNQYLSVVFFLSNSTGVVFSNLWGAKQIPQGSILDILKVYGLRSLPRAHSVNQQAQPHRHTVNIACHKNVTAMVTHLLKLGILGQKLPISHHSWPQPILLCTNRAPLIALTALLVNAVETMLDLTAWMIKAVKMGDFFQRVWFDNQQLSRVSLMFVASNPIFNVFLTRRLNLPYFYKLVYNPINYRYIYHKS